MAAVLPLAPRVGRQGRQPRAVEDLRDRRDELTAHNAEALEFVADVRPRIQALIPALRELGPLHYQTGLGLLARLASYEARHRSPDDPAAEAAA